MKREFRAAIRFRSREMSLSRHCSGVRKESTALILTKERAGWARSQAWRESIFA
jgi:hypothetical protein